MLYIDEIIYKEIINSETDYVGARVATKRLKEAAVLTKIVYDYLNNVNYIDNTYFATNKEISKIFSKKINLLINVELLYDRNLKKYIQKTKSGVWYPIQRHFEYSEYKFSDKLFALIERVKSKKAKILVFNEDSISESKKGVHYKSKYFYKDEYFNTKHEIAKKYFTGNSVKEYTEYLRALHPEVVTMLTYNIFKECKKDTITNEEYIKIIYGAEETFDISHETEINIENLHDEIKKAKEEKNSGLLWHLNKILLLSNNNKIKMNYIQTHNGRLYLRNNPFQSIPKKIRNKLLSEYESIDISNAIYNILFNYATLNKYKGGLNNIKNYIDNPEKMRYNIHKQLLETDKEVTQKYVKTFLTCIPYGASLSVNYVIADIESENFYSIPYNISGYGDLVTPLKICNLDEVKSLIKEVKEVSKWIIKHLQYSKNGDRYIKNIIDNIYEIKKGDRVGKKIAHIYQGIEFKMLECMYNYKINKRTLLEDNNIGLLLHDGLYVKKNVLSQKNIEQIEKNIYKKLKYKIKINKE